MNEKSKSKAAKFNQAKNMVNRAMFSVIPTTNDPELNKMIDAWRFEVVAAFDYKFAPLLSMVLAEEEHPTDCNRCSDKSGSMSRIRNPRNAAGFEWVCDPCAAVILETDEYMEAHKVNRSATPPNCGICGHEADHPSPCPMTVNGHGDGCGCTHEDWPAAIAHFDNYIPPKAEFLDDGKKCQSCGILTSQPNKECVWFHSPTC